MKPVFTVKILDSGIAPSLVQFTQTDGDLSYWDFGDGTLGTYDAPGQLVITHTYRKAGVFPASAIGYSDVTSDTVLVTILSSPTPPPPDPSLSLWQRFINWLKKLLGV